MKNSDEMVNSLFERRKQYEKEKKQKRKMLACMFTTICFVCLVAGIGVFQSGILEKNHRNADSKIIINKMEGMPSYRIDMELKKSDLVEMNKAELNEYYGINIFPIVPKDLKEWNQVYGIYKQNDGIGNVYWDQTVLNYSNEDVSRLVNLEIKKGSLPILDYGFGDSTEEKSIINNQEVFIGYSESSGYHAIFMYQDIGFCVHGDGLSQDEFIAILTSLIK